MGIESVRSSRQMRGSRALVAALAVMCAALSGLLYRQAAECRRQSSRGDTLYLQAKALEREAAASQAVADSLRARIAALPPSPIHPAYIDRLREQGLKQPIENLIADLRCHPEVIPYSGVLGGRMGFSEPDRIRVLSDSWVYAPFEDGHVSGEAIFSYRVGPGGKDHVACGCFGNEVEWLTSGSSHGAPGGREQRLEQWTVLPE